MKLTDDAYLYAETLKALDAPDPLSGETPADKELRMTSAKWDAKKRALTEVVTSGWGRKPASPPRRKVKISG